MRYADVNGTRVSMLGIAASGEAADARPAARIARRTLREVVDRSIELGVNLFEVPQPASQGAAAAALGRALARHPRDSYLLAAEFCVGRPGFRRDFARALRRAGTGRIDLCIVRGQTASGAASGQEDAALGFLAEQRRTGRIGQLGLALADSGRPAPAFAEGLPWDFVQLRGERESLWRDEGRAACEACGRAGLPVVVGPVRAGMRASLGVRADAVLRAQEPRASIASWAVRGAMGLPGVKAVIARAGSREEVEDAAKVLSYARPLDARELMALGTALAVQGGQATIPCTACGLCVDDCPRSIDIPGALAVYDELARGRMADEVAIPAGAAAMRGPWACVSCGACAELCPQQIDIPALMRRMARGETARS